MKEENLWAIKKGIRHWMLDIRRPLMNGDKILSLGNLGCFIWDSSKILVPCDGNHCDLCKINSYPDCKGCALEKNGMSCGKVGSPYNIFYLNPNLETANNMICALVCTYWAEMDGEND